MPLIDPTAPAPRAPQPPAVPTYAANPDELHKALGVADAYITQLAAELRRRAVETNEIHDQLLAARIRIRELEEPS